MRHDHLSADPGPGVRARRWAPAAGAAAALLLATAAPAQEYTTYLAGAVDGDETNLVLLGASVRPGGLGLQPVAGLQVYRLGYPSGTEDVDVYSISPSLGAYYRAEGGSLSAKMSYSFKSGDDEDVVVPFFEGGESGFGTSVQAIWWGTKPELQGIASYGWDSDFLWTQVQGVYPVVSLDPGSIDLGAEYIWQGDVGDDGASSQLYGPVLRWATGAGVYTFVSGGWKNNSSDVLDDTWYARASIVWSP